MTIEDGIEKIVGRFGKYQAWIWFLIIIGRLPTEYQLTCVVFVIPGVEYKCLDTPLNTSIHCPCEHPDYDRSAMFSSVVTEWNLTCDRVNLASIAQSSMLLGLGIGSLIFGYISDRYGRKLAVLLCLFLEAAFTAISGLVPEFWMFLVSHFLIGIAAGGTLLCSYVLFIEMCGASFRPYAGALIDTSYFLGYFTLSIFAYYVRHWRMLQLVLSVPWLVVIVYYWLIPESPRWLITKGKNKQAVNLLTYIAIINNRSTENIENIVEQIEAETICKHKKESTFADLFRTPKIRLYTIICSFIWFFCAHSFYGVNMKIGRLQGNIYLNVMFSALSIIPGIIVLVITSLYLKRRVSVVASFTITASSLLLHLIIPNNLRYLTITLAIVGMAFAYTAFIQMYLFTSELFPTVIRNSALGCISTFGRLGGFIAPFVLNIGIEWLTIVIFSGVSLAAAFLCYFLPETKDMTLMNSIEESERQYNNDNAKYTRHTHI